MKNVLILMTDLDYGGGAKTLIDYLNSVDYSKVNVSLYLIDDIRALSGELNKNVNIKCLNTKKNSKILKKLKMINALFNPKYIKNNFYMYDLVIGYTEYYPTYLASMISRINKIKSVTWVHTDLSKNPNSNFKRFIHKVLGSYFYKNIDEVMVVSNYIGKVLVRQYGNSIKKITLLYNPYNYELIEKKSKQIVKNIEPDKINICYVGRLSAEKNIMCLVKSMLYLKNISNFRLHLVGDGIEKGKIIDFINKHNLQSKIILHGFKDNPYKYMKVSDLIVVPSISEAFGGVIIEAQSLGVPVIGNDVGGISEIIENGYNGILIKDITPEKLAIKIEYLIHNSNFRQNITQNALLSIQKYSDKQSFKSFNNIIE